MSRTNQKLNENGSAMLISLAVLTLLTMVGTLFLAQSNIETQISGHDMRATQALYAAEAGHAEALARMSDSSDLTNYIGRPAGDWSANPGWGTYIVAANGSSMGDADRNLTGSDGLDNDLDGAIDEEGEVYLEVVTAQGDDAIDYPWVKVEYKKNAAGQVIVFGDHDNDLSTQPILNLTKGVPVIHVTAAGATGSSGRTVEIEAVKAPATVYHAAMYVEDDKFKFNGTQWKISGEDHNPSDGTVVSGSTSVPGVATTEDPNAIIASLGHHQGNNIEGEGGTPSVHSATVDLDLQGIADSWTPLADLVLPGGNYGNITWGGIDDYRVVHVTGQLHGSGQMTGGGVLVVDGDFFISGQFTWYGLVIVMGDIFFTGGGQGIHIYGSAMIQGAVKGQTVSGNADVVYSSETLGKLANLSPYVISSWHEL